MNPHRDPDPTRTQGVESRFTRNEYGLWCPNCQEAIDQLWPVECDHCGYPSPDCEQYDHSGDDFDQWRFERESKDRRFVDGIDEGDAS